MCTINPKAIAKITQVIASKPIKQIKWNNKKMENIQLVHKRAEKEEKGTKNRWDK